MSEVRTFSDNETRARPDYMAYQQTVPANTTAAASNGPRLLGKVQNKLDIIVRVYTDVVISDTKVFSVKLQTSSDNGVADAYADLATIYTVTASGETTLAAGTELARYAISTDKELWFKAVMISDDAAITGAVNIYPVLIEA